MGSKTTRVRNMTSPSSGREIANQFIIEDGADTCFQSYNTIIAKVERNEDETRVYLDPAWDCSVTTGKYRNKFLRENKKETEAKIKDGIYIVTNLN